MIIFNDNSLNLSWSSGDVFDLKLNSLISQASFLTSPEVINCIESLKKMLLAVSKNYLVHGISFEGSDFKDRTV